MIYGFLFQSSRPALSSYTAPCWSGRVVTVTGNWKEGLEGKTDGSERAEKRGDMLQAQAHDFWVSSYLGDVSVSVAYEKLEPLKIPRIIPALFSV